MFKKIMPFVAAVAICAASCGKPYSNTINPVPVPTVKYDLVSVFASNAVTAKTVTIDAATGGSFVGNGGARYIFPPNGFRTASGALVTGNVTIRAAEFLSKADMIFSGVLPISYGQPLISGGETYIRATQGSNEVYMASGKQYTVKLPQKKTPPPGMQLFLAGGSYRTTDLTNTVNWAPDSSGTHGFVIIDGDSLSMSSDSLHFANADRFMYYPDYQNFTITINAGSVPVGDTMMVYTSYDDYNGVWPNYGKIGPGVYNEGHVPNIPVHFVIIAIINGGLYSGTLGATPVSGSNYSITLSQTTPDDFKKLVKAL